jgi:hypothetical protein
MVAMIPTRDSIMAMTPAELREAIAKAKGYVNVHEGYNDTLRGIKLPNNYKAVEIANWPENISAAWKLFEEMPHPEIYHGTYINGANYWRCACGKWDYGEPEYECEADTAPLAICRAWLMWKEDKNER